MPGVPGATMQGIDRRKTHGNFRRISAAYDDRAGMAKVTDQGGVTRCDDIGQSRKSVRRRLTLLVDVHLYGDRHPEKRSRLGKRRQFAVRSGGLGKCLASEVDDNRVQLRVEGLDALGDRMH